MRKSQGGRIIIFHFFFLFSFYSENSQRSRHDVLPFWLAASVFVLRDPLYSSTYVQQMISPFFPFFFLYTNSVPATVRALQRCMEFPAIPNSAFSPYSSYSISLSFFIFLPTHISSRCMTPKGTAPIVPANSWITWCVCAYKQQKKAIFNNNKI